jgi:hypothetical protein
MKESMRASAAAASSPGFRGQRARHCGLLCWIGLWYAAAGPLACAARAQGLLVVEASEADHASAEKLRELIKEPFALTRAQATLSAADIVPLCCRAGAERGLVLDSAHHAVQFVRCRDATVLTRVVDPATAEAPYFAAFIGAELLALAAELDGQPPSPAAVSGPPPRTLLTRLRVRLGVELIALGVPYAGAPRASLGLGLSSEHFPAPLAWFLEFSVAPLASGERSVSGGSLQLTRSDARLRGGVLYPLPGFDLLGFVEAFGALTDVDYRAAQPTRSTQLGWGLGAGIEGDLALARYAQLYANLTLDAAISRSEYRVDGAAQFRDPALLLTVSGGFVLTPAL